MSQSIDSTTDPSSAMESDFIHLQLTQALETFREQFNLIVQIITIFVLTDVTILGFAVGNQIAGFVVIAAIIPVVVLFVVRGADRFMLPVLYTAVVLEKKYGKPDTDWLASVYVSSTVSTVFMKHLQDIGDNEDPIERIRLLRSQRLTMIDRKHFRIALIFFSLAQVATAIVLSLVFNWRFF